MRNDEFSANSHEVPMVTDQEHHPESVVPKEDPDVMQDGGLDANKEAKSKSTSRTSREGRSNPVKTNKEELQDDNKNKETQDPKPVTEEREDDRESSTSSTDKISEDTIVAEQTKVAEDSSKTQEAHTDLTTTDGPTSDDELNMADDGGGKQPEQDRTQISDAPVTSITPSTQLNPNSVVEPKKETSESPETTITVPKDASPLPGKQSDSHLDTATSISQDIAPLKPTGDDLHLGRTTQTASDSPVKPEEKNLVTDD